MKIPFDLSAYEQRVRTGGCFVCNARDGVAGFEHEIVYDDGEHLAFLARWPTMRGYVLVCPRRHVEHNFRDLDRNAYLRLQDVVYRVASAVESVVPSERTYALSLGSQQGNSHLHWHIAPLPPGTPYDQQQYHALMQEYGVIGQTPAEAAALATQLRQALAMKRPPN